MHVTLVFYGQLKQYISVASELCVIGKLILQSTRIIVIPSKLRPRVLFFNTLANEGHPGIVSMKQRLGSRVWWPVTDKETEKILQNVFGYQLVSSPAHPEPIKSTPLPQGPRQGLALDLLLLLPPGDCVSCG